jgi:hypothetical protein
VPAPASSAPRPSASRCATAWKPPIGLVVKGIREPLTFTGRIEEATAGALTLTGSFTADRERFGMTWNQGGMIKGLTTVSFRIVFHRAGS